MKTDQSLRLGLEHHQAGRLGQAEQVYRGILAADPACADAAYFLGRLYETTGHAGAAVEMIQLAIRINPNRSQYFSDLTLLLRRAGRPDEASRAAHRAVQLSPGSIEALNSLANCLRDGGQFDAAAAVYGQAVRIAPGSSELQHNLGNALRDQGRLLESISALNEAIRLQPGNFQARTDLGTALRDSGELDQSIEQYRLAIEAAPGYAEAPWNLGNALLERGRIPESVASLRRAAGIRPDDAGILSSLGAALREAGQTDDAIAVIRRAIELRPDYPEAYTNLGIALRDAGQTDEAVAASRRSIELQPDHPGAYTNLGIALRDSGRTEESIAAHRKTIELLAASESADDNPLASGSVSGPGIRRRGPNVRSSTAAAALHSNLLFDLCSSPETDLRLLFDESREWNRCHAAPFASRIRAHANDLSAGRKLRIGYVSGDFRNHPVGRFMLPIVAGHDRSCFEICCYSNTVNDDSLTDWFRASCDRWRSVVGLDDDAASELVRQDRIDILVDLSLHTARNRLGIFARKAAPVQTAYLAYCATSGMDTIDYLLCDRWLVPMGGEAGSFTEIPLRLPGGYWCYRPPEPAPAVTPLPALSAGHVTFGCLNNFGKVTTAAVNLWCEVLRRVPGSRLRLHAREGAHRRRTEETLRLAGIDPARLDFVAFLPMEQYLQQWLSVDVALDTFPFNGGTTTCDALWMGVPVVTMPGETPVSRAGLSVLSNAGLGNLVAEGSSGYVARAVALAADLEGLSSLRGSLRATLRSSPLTDEPGFIAGLESAYRQVWIAYVENTKRQL